MKPLDRDIIKNKKSTTILTEEALKDVIPYPSYYLDKPFQVERDILIFAMRYALGRMTFAPLTVIDNIKHNIDLFMPNDLKILIKDIDEQASLGYGMDCDEKVWLGFKKYLLDILEDKI